MTNAILIPHPTTSRGSVDRFTVQARGSKEGWLSFHYAIEGDLAGVRLPAPKPPDRADQLWRSTCFEAFLAGREPAGYYEFNFAPSTEWAIYRFSAYRAGMTPVEPVKPPAVTLRAGPNRLTLEVFVRLPGLAMAALGGNLRLGLSAVIENQDDQISYWALRHPPGPPDFHHGDGFALPLLEMFDVQGFPDTKN